MRIKKAALLFVSALALGTAAPSLFAHLCNDVFVQAKDNLAVKVDIRDDQLRISKTGKFRVYLLNTMDRDIANIQLEVKSKEFKATVAHSPEWSNFPSLKTVSKGGQKEYFEVELARKPDTPQGKYKIELHLFNGKKESMVFKTVEIEDAMSLQKVPKASSAPKIDGSQDSSEWQKGLLCSSLYEYKRSGKFFENCQTELQTRFRFLHDDKNLYCAVDFQKPGSSDAAKLLVASSYDSKPVIVEADLQAKTVKLNGEDAPGLKVAVSGAKMEIAIPLDKLGVAGEKSFYVNLARTQDGAVTYWRGNQVSLTNPVVFANFVMD